MGAGGTTNGNMSLNGTQNQQRLSTIADSKRYINEDYQQFAAQQGAANAPSTIQGMYNTARQAQPGKPSGASQPGPLAPYGNSLNQLAAAQQGNNTVMPANSPAAPGTLDSWKQQAQTAAAAQQAANLQMLAPLQAAQAQGAQTGKPSGALAGQNTGYGLGAGAATPTAAPTLSAFQQWEQMTPEQQNADWAAFNQGKPSVRAQMDAAQAASPHDPNKYNQEQVGYLNDLHRVMQMTQDPQQKMAMSKVFQQLLTQGFNGYNMVPVNQIQGGPSGADKLAAMQAKAQAYKDSKQPTGSAPSGYKGI